MSVGLFGCIDKWVTIYAAEDICTAMKYCPMEAFIN